MNRWLLVLVIVSLSGCSLPFGLGSTEPTVTPQAVTAPPPTLVTEAAPLEPIEILATETTTPTITATISPTLTVTLTMTPTATISMLMPPAQTLIAQHTATFVAPFATGRPTIDVQLPLVELPTRPARQPAPPLTPEVRELIPGQELAGTVTPVSGTPTAEGSVLEVEWNWRESNSGALLEADGLVRNAGSRPVTLITIDIAFRDGQGALLATAQALASVGDVLEPGQQATWSTTTSNPGNVTQAEIIKLDWDFSD